MASFSERLELAFQTVKKPDGSEFSNYDVQRGTDGAITASYVARLRSGSASNPTIKVVQGIAQFFGLPASFFIDEEASTESDSVGIALRTLTEDSIEQQFLLDALDAIRKLRSGEE